VKKIAGMYILLTKKGPLFLADTTVNISPTAEELADITLLVAKEVRNFNMEPRVAMLIIRPLEAVTHQKQDWWQKHLKL
jgi:malate dehydrogenase (oxaloacetate-decarboxylating)(NADP+)